MFQEGSYNFKYIQQYIFRSTSMFTDVYIFIHLWCKSRFFGIANNLVKLEGNSLTILIFQISYNISTISILKLSFITSTFIVYMFGINYGGEQIRQFSKKVLLAT